jgi:hypothetical protein
MPNSPKRIIHMTLIGPNWTHLESIQRLKSGFFRTEFVSGQTVAFESYPQDGIVFELEWLVVDSALLDCRNGDHFLNMIRKLCPKRTV